MRFLEAVRAALADQGPQCSPCNAVVRSLDERTTIVEAFDPDAMMGLAGDAYRDVAATARTPAVPHRASGGVQGAGPGRVLPGTCRWSDLPGTFGSHAPARWLLAWSAGQGPVPLR